VNRSFMRQAQELQAKLAKAQAELAETIIETSSGGGAVKVTANGQQQVLSVKISPEAIESGDAEMLEDLVMTAVNEALTKAQEMAAKRMGKLTGGLNIPGLT
jgi:DNA-binding YbaB/EbfC family protein